MEKKSTQHKQRAAKNGPDKQMDDIMLRLRALRKHFVDTNRASDYRRISNSYDGVAVQFWVGPNTAE